MVISILEITIIYIGITQKIRNREIPTLSLPVFPVPRAYLFQNSHGLEGIPFCLEKEEDRAADSCPRECKLNCVKLQ